MAHRNELEPEESLQRLLEGNWRFRSDRLTRPNQGAQSRLENSVAPHPLAGILTCSDSRLLMENIFDCGVGDLFVCRIAGNFADECVVGSLEYAVQELGVRLLMVVGHESCGAIQAALKNERPLGHIERLVQYAMPAVDEARGAPGELLDNAVRANIRLTVEALRNAEPVLRQAVSSGHIAVRGAYYHLVSGEIEIMHF